MAYGAILGQKQNIVLPEYLNSFVPDDIVSSVPTYLNGIIQAYDTGGINDPPKIDIIEIGSFEYYQTIFGGYSILNINVDTTSSPNKRRNFCLFINENTKFGTAISFVNQTKFFFDNNGILNEYPTNATSSTGTIFDTSSGTLTGFNIGKYIIFYPAPLIIYT